MTGGQLTDFDELIGLADRIFGPLEVAGPHLVGLLLPHKVSKFRLSKTRLKEISLFYNLETE